MKLRAVYFENAKGEPRCTLLVMDKGAFMTDRIFQVGFLQAPFQVTSLDGEHESVIIAGSNWIDLTSKVHAVIGRIRDLLADYHEVNRPVTETFDL